ncbi:MAG: UDP-4-amino-4,6-dideoxy-N-acetyl-beta-L-altrosamine transaminase [Rhodospirillales bacterium]|nr:UDP-4-amino-4,6-dideoxy-N-acetyl-beta-L-altrosamine transaminase [Rhodospirillales bacterium]
MSGEASNVLPYGRQSIDEADIEAVVAVLRSDWLTQGPAVEKFEREIAEHAGADYAVAVCNGTAALHVAAIAAGLEPGRRLWTTPNTFVASANCGLYCGAEIDFVDIDQRDGNMSADRLAERLEDADRKGALPQVVVPVHFGGQACDMERIARLRDRYGFKIIEDACHALGGRDRSGSPVGSCRFSDMAAFSFHPVKIVTTAEGGAVTTNDAGLAGRLRLARTHGITRDTDVIGEALEDPWAYRQVAVGYNYRMTDIQAALGVSQLRRLQTFVDRRNALARRYDAHLADLPVTPLTVHPDAVSGYHLYAVRIGENPAGLSRRDVFEALAAHGIRCQVHYIPVHLHPVYRARGFKPGDFPEAEAYYQDTLTLPLFPAMTDADQDRVIDALGRIFSGPRA